MDMQTPSPLRSGHLDIKDAQCAENKDGRKISYRVWVQQGLKRGVLGAQKLNFLQKWLILLGRLELIWRSFLSVRSIFWRKKTVHSFSDSLWEKCLPSLFVATFISSLHSRGCCIACRFKRRGNEFVRKGKKHASIFTDEIGEEVYMPTSQVNIIKSDRNQTVFTIFRLIWNRMDVWNYFHRSSDSFTSLGIIGDPFKSLSWTHRYEISVMFEGFQWSP